MTVYELMDKLQILTSEGHGNVEVRYYDAEMHNQSVDIDGVDYKVADDYMKEHVLIS